MNGKFLLFLVLLHLSAFGQHTIELDRVGNHDVYRLIPSNKKILVQEIKQDRKIELGTKFKMLQNFINDTTDYLYAKLDTVGSIVTDRPLQLLVFDYNSDRPVYLIDDSIPNEFRLVTRVTNLNNTQLVHLRIPKAGLIDNRVTLHLVKDFSNKKEDVILPKYYFEYTSNTSIVVGDYSDENTSFSIGIFDVNSNGIFGEIGIDNVFVDQFGQNYFSISNNPLFNSSTTIKENLIIGVGDHKFLISRIDSLGQKIEIKKADSSAIPTIRALLSLPDFSFRSVSDSILKSTNLLVNDRYLFIEIWSWNCPPCIKAFPVLNEIYATYSNKVTILGLFDRGTDDELKSIIEKFKLNFPQGYASKETNTILGLNGYPTGLLFDSKGMLITRLITAKDLLNLLKENKI